MVRSGLSAWSRRQLVAAGGGAALFGVSSLAGCRKAPARPHLTVGDQKGGLRSLLAACGGLSDLDYTLEWAEFGVSAALFAALNAGAIDAGVAGDAPFVFFLANHPSVKAIAALDMAAGVPNTAGILVPAGSSLHDLHDLVGKRVAVVHGSAGQFVTLVALRRAGLPLQSVTFVYLSPSEGMTALLQGDVDAWGTWDPYLSLGELEHGMRLLDIPKNLIAGVGFLVATDDAIKTKRAILRDFTGRLTRARLWAAANPAAYAAAFSRDTGMPLDAARRYVASTNYTVAAISGSRVGTVQNLVDLYKEAKLLPPSFQIGSGFDQSFLSDR